MAGYAAVKKGQIATIENKKLFASKMTREQIAEAQRLSRKCLARIQGTEAPQRAQYSKLTPGEQVDRYMPVLRQYEKRRSPKAGLAGA